MKPTVVIVSDVTKAVNGYLDTLHEAGLRPHVARHKQLNLEGELRTTRAVITLPERRYVVIDREYRLQLLSNRGFLLVEALISMTISMIIVAALTSVLLSSAKLAATLATAASDRQIAQAHLQIQLVNLTTAVPGTVVTLDPSTPPDQPCQLWQIVSTQGNQRVEGYASRGCAAQ